MLQLAEEGFERQIYDKYFGQLFNPQCQTSSFAPVGFEIVLTLFKMLVIGCGVAMLCMLSELMVDKFINWNTENLLFYWNTLIFPVTWPRQVGHFLGPVVQNWVAQFWQKVAWPQGTSRNVRSRGSKQVLHSGIFWGCGSRCWSG